MVIVDTTVWIDFLRGTENPETLWLDRQLQRQRLALTDLILAEVLQGVPDRNTFKRVQTELSKFEIFAAGGNTLAVAAASDYIELRSRGYTVRKTIDCLIATFCLRAGHELLHRDRDFDPFKIALGLRVVRAS